MISNHGFAPKSEMPKYATEPVGAINLSGHNSDIEEGSLIINGILSPKCHIYASLGSGHVLGISECFSGSEERECVSSRRCSQPAHFGGYA